MYQYREWFTSGTVFQMSKMNVLVIGLGPGSTGRVDFTTATQTFHRDLDIEPGVNETIKCSLGDARIEVVLKPGKDDGRVDVEARAWSGVVEPSEIDGNKGHRWSQARLRPDREQRMELQWR